MADAIVVIVHQSVLFMRAMAHRRETMCDEFFPGCDYQQQIRELADVCDNLVPGLRPTGPRRPQDALQSPGTTEAGTNRTGSAIASQHAGSESKT